MRRKYNQSEMWTVIQRETPGNQAYAEKSSIEKNAETGQSTIKLYENHGATTEVEQHAADLLGGQGYYVCEDEKYKIVYEVESGKVIYEGAFF